MAITVLTNVSVTYNSVDLSDHVESVEVNQSYDQVEITAMGASARTFTPGLRDDEITLNFYQDFAAGEVHQTLQALVGSAAGAALVIKPTTAATSTVNPAITVTCAPYEYSALSGAVGDASQTSVTFKPSAGSAIVYATS
jgi:hypothetical protein